MVEVMEEIHERAGSPTLKRKLLIHNKPYEKPAGTACFAPYVDVSISALTGRKSVDVSFKARIDTGADITCIPESQAKMLMPLPRGKPIRTRGHDGTTKYAKTSLAAISIHGYPGGDQLESYRPERGVLLTDSDVGLLGMDIIGKDWNLTIDAASQTFSVELV